MSRPSSASPAPSSRPRRTRRARSCTRTTSPRRTRGGRRRGRSTPRRARCWRRCAGGRRRRPRRRRRGARRQSPSPASAGRPSTRTASTAAGASRTRSRRRFGFETEVVGGAEDVVHVFRGGGDGSSDAGRLATWRRSFIPNVEALKATPDTTPEEIAALASRAAANAALFRDDDAVDAFVNDAEAAVNKALVRAHGSKRARRHRARGVCAFRARDVGSRAVVEEALLAAKRERWRRRRGAARRRRMATEETASSRSVARKKEPERSRRISGPSRVGRRPGTRDAAGEEEGAGKVLQGANRRVQDQEGAFAGARRHPGPVLRRGMKKRKGRPDAVRILTEGERAEQRGCRERSTRRNARGRRDASRGGSPARVPRREAGVQTGDRVCGSGGGFGRAGVHKSREAPRASQPPCSGAAGGAEGLEKARGRPERPRRAHAPPARSVAKQPHDRSQQGGHHPAQARGRGGDGGRGASPRDEPEPASRRRNVPAMPIAAEQARQVLRLRLRRVRVRKRPGVAARFCRTSMARYQRTLFSTGSRRGCNPAPDQSRRRSAGRRQRDRRSRREGCSVRRVQARPGLGGDVRHEVRQGVLHSLARRDRALDAAAGAERKGAAAVRRVQNSGDHAEALRHRAGRAGVRSKASEGDGAAGDGAGEAERSGGRRARRRRSPGRARRTRGASRRARCSRPTS